MPDLENEIRNSLLDEGKNKMISGGFKVLIKGDGQIEVKELPRLNLKQLELPLVLQPVESKKGGKNYETTKLN